MSKMTSRFRGSCRICGGRIAPGVEIDYTKAEGASHWHCKQDEAALPAGVKTYEIGGGSGYGCAGWKSGQIVRANKREVEHGHPKFLFVLRTRAQYFREDGLSFGVGDDDGYLYTATCREATVEEAAPLLAAEVARERKAAAAAELKAIAAEIRAAGERPAGDNRPEGERVADTGNIYGGGDWFVVGPEHIWYCQNNGTDGGDWSYNNVRTGGAGAIGWRVPATPELAARIRTAATEVKA